MPIGDWGVDDLRSNHHHLRKQKEVIFSIIFNLKIKKMLLQNISLLATAFLTLFGTAEVLFHKFMWKAEYTRKLVHIGTGLLTLLFPLFINEINGVAFLCFSFITILILSMKYDLLQSINGVKRKTFGSILYPIIVFVTYFVYKQEGHLIYFYAPILTMAIADPMAALVGKRWQKGVYHIYKNDSQTNPELRENQKTVIGSFAFLVTAFFVNYGLFTWFSLEHQFLTCVLIASSTMIIEGISTNGYDNFTIPLTVLVVLYFSL